MSGPVGFPFAGFGLNPSFIGFLEKFYDGNLQLVLDPGDVNCMASSSAQTVSDLKNANDLWMGSDGTSEGIDPSFVGTPGALTDEYWDFVRANSEVMFWKSAATVLRDFIDNGTTASMCLMFYPDDTTSSVIFDNRGFGTAAGTYIQLNTSKVVITGSNGVTLAVLNYTTTASITTSAWNFLGWSNDESGGASASFINLNGTVETFNGNAGTQSVTPTGVSRLGRDLGNLNPMDGRLGPFAAWDTNLSQDAMEHIRLFLARRYA